MMRTWEQCQRLAIEEKLLARYTPDFRFYNKTGDAYIDGWVMTSGGANWYRLWVGVPPEYPYSPPHLYVGHPHPLWMCGYQRTINSLGTSHAFHVLDNPNGWVKICHTEYWDASLTCLKILLKGVMWLEAYEAHLRTGQNIADFLC